MEWRYLERVVSTLIRWLRSVVLPVAVVAAAAVVVVAAALGGCGGSMAVGGLGMVDLAVCEWWFGFGTGSVMWKRKN